MKDWNGWDTAGIVIIACLLAMIALGIDLHRQLNRDQPIIDGVRKLQGTE